MKHCIIAKFNPGEFSDAVLADVRALFARAESLPGISKISVCRNVVDLPNRADIAVIITMEREALKLWNECAVHKEWKRIYGEKLASKLVIDLD